MRLIAYPILFISLILLTGCGTETTTTNAPDSTESAAPDSAAAPEANSDAAPAAGDSGQTEESSGDSAAADTEKPTLASFGERMQKAVEANEIDEAMRITEEAVAAYPENMEVQLNRLVLTIGNSQRQEATDPDAAAVGYLKGGEYARELLPRANEVPEQYRSIFALALVNSARGYAQQGKVSESLAGYNEAIDAGVSHLNDMDQDPFLAKVLDDAAFKAGIEQIQAKLQEKIVEECREEIAQTEAFPFDVNLPDVDGNPVKLSDYKGKIVIVDVWGTWCPPCKKEIPHFVQLLEENKDDLAIIGVNYEHVEAADAPATIKQFVEENGINYPCVIGDEDTQNQIPNLRGFPTTLFLDRSGKVRLMLVGYHAYDRLETYFNLLRESPELPN